MVQRHDMGVRDHFAGPAPPGLDGGGCARGEGDDLRRGGDEHVKVLCMSALVDEMRVDQVVNREHQRQVVAREFVSPAAKLRRIRGVETEMQVGEMELRMVVPHPPGVEHHRRPPLAGLRVGNVRCRVGEPDNGIAGPSDRAAGGGWAVAVSSLPAVRGSQGREIPHVGMIRRDRRHPDLVGHDHAVP